MTHPTRFLFALALLTIPPPAPAGSITYDFHDLQWPYFGLGRLVVDDAVLSRGYLTQADATAFGFAPFFLADLTPFRLSIGPDGIPTDGGSITAGRIGPGGTVGRLYVSFGPDSFDPGIGGYYRVLSGIGTGTSGPGYWTATIDATPTLAAVPGPPGIVLACMAGVCVLLTKGAIGHE